MTRVTTRKWVYLFEEGNAQMRDLLGGKGAGLAEMTNVGLPVPPGFTITTEACVEYYRRGRQFPEGLWDQVLTALRTVEEKSGKRFGDPNTPLMVSVRSGAKFSMPGMMDTVLNLGLNDEVLAGLIRLTGNPRFAYDAYRRFIQMFGRIVLGIDAQKFDEIFEAKKRERGAEKDTDLTADDLAEVVAAFKELVRKETGQDFPQDPYEQLRLAIRAVFESWNNPRAVAYREYYKIPHDLGTAVNVQMMVFGNMGEDSGSGVAFTRNPATGEKELYGEYLPNAQGEDVVAGIRTPLKITELKESFPEIYRQLEEIARRLELHYKDVQDIEFTVERGKLYMLQTRAAQRTAQAAVKVAVDLALEGIISREEAVRRVKPAQVEELLKPRFDPEAKRTAAAEGKLLARGVNASPGAAVGQAVFDADTAVEWARAGREVILVRTETNPDDVHGMIAARGVLTARGGATSHAAVVARGLGKPAVVGCEALAIDEHNRLFTVNGVVVREGDYISIDGTTGEVFLGAIPTVERSFAEQTELRILLEWADQFRRLGVWANADYPRDAAKALEFGAEGIGLCRTEHMFFEPERLPFVHDMILHAREATAAERELQRAKAALETAEPARKAQAEAEYRQAEEHYRQSEAVRRYYGALAELEKFQTEDFKGIFRVMGHRPVVIRLLDPPLHEFLPRYEELLVQVTQLRLKGTPDGELAEKQRLLELVESMREFNPMLGLRGCRLGILFPAIYEMQVRAIFRAVCDLKAEGLDPHPEVMIPLVGHANELAVIREQLETVARQVMAEKGQQVSYKFGTMIEVPRAALTADQVARYAEFFSFGTNDLTQMVFGMSRDDAEAKFLVQYVERGILPANPFQTLDADGVGKLMELGFKLGRQTRPDLEVGICGEHGGDPESIALCHRIGLNYVSASPYRIPVARLAAAQAALAEAAMAAHRYA